MIFFGETHLSHSTLDSRSAPAAPLPPDCAHQHPTAGEGATLHLVGIQIFPTFLVLGERALLADALKKDSKKKIAGNRTTLLAF